MRKSLYPAALRPLAVAALALGLIAVAPPAQAAPAYPTNVCVGTKLKAAGKYCGAVLKAWSTWDKKQDAAKRDASIAKAQDKLDATWLDAEAKSAEDGVDCAETTVSAADLGVLVGTTAAQIAAAVNTGFDLGDKDEGKCGGSLLKLAAKKCQALLLAEGKFVAGLAKDPPGEKRADKLSKATTKFSEGWAKVLSKGCAPTATEGDTESSVDALRDDIVTNTTVSPNVDDTQYTAIAPVGPIDYQGRAFSPVCMNGSPYQFFVKRGTVNKLLMYYQGGGACWEQLTCSVPVCDASVDGGRQSERRDHRLLRTAPIPTTRSGTGTSCSSRTAAATSTSATRRRTTTTRTRPARCTSSTAAIRTRGRREVGARALRQPRAGVRHRLERRRVRRVVQRRRSWSACGRRRKFDVLADAGNGVITQTS